MKRKTKNIFFIVGAGIMVVCGMSSYYNIQSTDLKLAFAGIMCFIVAIDYLDCVKNEED